MRILFLLFLIVPILEMWLLITVGSFIGAWPTIALVFLTAALGLALLRQQGLSTLFRVNKKMESGELPAGEIAEGLFLAVGGALLLTPGFITDAIGFACLLPWSRRWLSKRWLSHFQMSGFVQGADFYTTRYDRSSGDVFEGECSRDVSDDQRLK